MRSLAPRYSQISRAIFQYRGRPILVPFRSTRRCLRERRYRIHRSHFFFEDLTYAQQEASAACSVSRQLDIETGRQRPANSCSGSIAKGSSIDCGPTVPRVEVRRGRERGRGIVNSNKPARSHFQELRPGPRCCLSNRNYDLEHRAIGGDHIRRPSRSSCQVAQSATVHRGERIPCGLITEKSVASHPALMSSLPKRDERNSGWRFFQGSPGLSGAMVCAVQVNPFINSLNDRVSLYRR